jgi:hypothetical protein
MKFKVNFETVPALGLMVGYTKSDGLIVILGFISMQITKIKRKKHLESIKLHHKETSEKIKKAKLAMQN